MTEKKKTLRIAMISEHADPLSPLGGQQSGGQNVFVYELAKALSKLGVFVDVYTRWDNRKSSQVVRFAPRAKVIRLKAGPRHFVSKDKFGAIMPEFVEHYLEYVRVKKIKYDLVHSHYYFSGWAGMQIKNIYKMPLVHTFHSLGLVKKEAIGSADSSPTDRTKIEKKIVEIADKIIATSPQEKIVLMNGGYLKHDNVTVVPAGVNLLRFSKMDRLKSRKKLGLSEDKKIIVFAGRMEQIKGAKVLVNAINVIKKKDSNLFNQLEVLMFSGDPRKIQKKERTERGLRQQIRNSIKKFELENVVKLNNGLDQEKLHYYYGAADLVVVPSFYESFGMVAIEAMATGTPVVASDVGGLKWTIEDGITGFHAKVGNHRDFAKKIAAVLNDDSLEERMGENASIHVQNNYSWNMVAERTLGVYQSLINKD